MFISNLKMKISLFVTLFCVVFGVDGDEVKSVSVMEGESVTLHTDITQIQTDDHIVWMFGPQDTRIAQIFKKSPYKNDSIEIFEDRLKLDNQTGSLTITNITISGIYKLQTRHRKKASYKKFNVTVYAHLPVPVIIIDSSQCSSSSSSKCVLLCSVLNVRDVRDVSLTWYKGNRLLSSSNESDLNIRLSLPLEVEYQDTNTYRCVVNNTITNQTQHLNITDVFEQHSEQRHHYFIAIIIAVLGILTCGFGAWKQWKSRKLCCSFTCNLPQTILRMPAHLVHEYEVAPQMSVQ